MPCNLFILYNLGRVSGPDNVSLAGVLFQSEHCNLLLFEVPPLFLIDQHQVDVVLNAELVVDVSVSGREVVRAEEQSDGDGLACMKIFESDIRPTTASQHS